MAETVTLQDRIRSLSRASHARSPLAGPVRPQDVEVVAFKFDDIDGINQHLKMSRGVSIRYPSDAPGINIPEFSPEIERFRALAAAPEMNRLNNVRQLSTAHVSSAIGGVHSRLEHTLGAFDTAILMLKVAYRYAVDSDRTKPRRYANPQRDLNFRAALTLAFFHDAFHPPFGHVLDPLRPVLLPQIDSPRIDNSVKYLEFERGQREKGLVFALLATVFQDRRLRINVIERSLLLMDNANADELPDDLKPYGFLFDILWGPLDHDRFDYLFRDVAHVFPFARERPPRLSSLVDHIVCLPNDGEIRLTFDVPQQEIDDFLLLRQRMYNEVYEGELKAPFDEAILHAVIFILIEHNRFEAWRPLEPDTDDWDFGIDFARLSDIDLIRLIDGLPLTPRMWIAKKLVGDLLANAPFRCAAHREIDNLELPLLAVRHHLWQHPFRSAVEELTQKFRFRPNRAEAKDALARLAAKLLGPAPIPASEKDNVHDRLLSQGLGRYIEPGSGDILPAANDALFWTLYGIGLRAFHRVRVERWFWERFIAQWPLYDTWSSDLAEAYVGERRTERISQQGTYSQEDALNDAVAFRRDLKSTPLVFVYMSRINPNDLNRLWMKDTSDEREALRRDRATGTLVPIRAKPIQSVNNYWAAIFRPQAMDDTADDLLAELFTEFLKTAWVELYADASLNTFVL